ncbi:hypothetical protein BH23GEM5_BH23GEM5_13900 [soil metagenome]
MATVEEHKPDVLIFDGQGYAHPRRFGIACHGGLVLGVPSVGYVSVGHHMDLTTAVGLVLKVCPRFREPETTRRAHRLVNELRRADHGAS